MPGDTALQGRDPDEQVWGRGGVMADGGNLSPGPVISSVGPRAKWTHGVLVPVQ